MSTNFTSRALPLSYLGRDWLDHWIRFSLMNQKIITILNDEWFLEFDYLPFFVHTYHQNKENTLTIIFEDIIQPFKLLLQILLHSWLLSCINFSHQHFYYSHIKPSINFSLAVFTDSEINRISMFFDKLCKMISFYMCIKQRI